MPRRMLLLAGLAAGCGGARPQVVPPSAPGSGEECVLASPGSRSSDTIVYAAAPADTGLLTPARARTPLGLSCAGQAVPRLASAWSTDTSRRSWTLVVPSAPELALRWRRDGSAADALRWAGVASVVPLDDRRLVVTFTSPQESVPGVFADPALGGLPEADSSRLRLFGEDRVDLRDAIDRGADLVVTADPDVLQYASTRPGSTMHPLPWSRIYVLLTPAAGTPPADLLPGDTAGFRASLARDAVRVAARPADGPSWWDAATDCGARAPGGDVPSPGIAYSSGDPVARAVAERIVATAEGSDLVVHPVVPTELADAVSRSAWSAYVLAVPKVALVPCREVAGWPGGASALPLIETRLTAIVREGTPPLLVEHDGGLVPRGMQ